MQRNNIQKTHMIFIHGENVECVNSITKGLIFWKSHNIETCYKCRMCKLKFKSEIILKQHMHKAHGENVKYVILK